MLLPTPQTVVVSFDSVSHAKSFVQIEKLSHPLHLHLGFYHVIPSPWNEALKGLHLKWFHKEIFTSIRLHTLSFSHNSISVAHKFIPTISHALPTLYCEDMWELVQAPP